MNIMHPIRDAKFQPGGQAEPQTRARPVFCGTRIKGARFVPDWGKAITMNYASVPGLRVVLERSDSWTLSWTHQVSCVTALGSGLGLGYFLCFFTRQPTF